MTATVYLYIILLFAKLVHLALKGPHSMAKNTKDRRMTSNLQYTLYDAFLKA